MVMGLVMAACGSGGEAEVHERLPETTTSTTVQEEVVETGEEGEEEAGGVLGEEASEEEEREVGVRGGRSPDVTLALRAKGEDDVLACIRSYEQGVDGYETDTGNGYYGAYQFDQETWESVGGSGNPAEASVEEQDMRAAELYRQRGLQPWPTPERMCGG